jgi:hypothetical protein
MSLQGTCDRFSFLVGFIQEYICFFKNDKMEEREERKYKEISSYKSPYPVVVNTMNVK